MSNHLNGTESPEVQAAFNHLLLWYGNEPWFVDIVSAHDDAGTRLEVHVEDALYVDDVLPRIIKTELGKFYIIVRRVDKLVSFEKPPQIAKA
jgi:hypothetical protein